MHNSPENKPLPFLTSRFIFTLFVSPCPYMLQKLCRQLKMNKQRLTRMLLFVCLDGLSSSFSAFSAKYHGQSVEISTQRLLMAAMAPAIGLG